MTDLPKGLEQAIAAFQAGRERLAAKRASRPQQATSGLHRPRPALPPRRPAPFPAGTGGGKEGVGTVNSGLRR